VKLSHFFIDRPIFAIVISIVTILLGAIGYTILPTALYPEIAPPTVVVQAQYPGADPKTLAETVAEPIEQQVNGVENMLYMSSYSGMDSTTQLTVTFKLGTDPNIAQVLVQNRVAIAEPQLPLEVRNIGVTTKKQIAEMAKSFPPGMEYTINYDPTLFTQQSIDAVYETLRATVILVVIVVMVFLQSWRIAVIPLIAVPVSLIGTFAVMAPLGFSLNSLSLFGLVLAIGIVVDDAIVVVENVERWIERGLDPKEAARKAMDEVGGAVISIAVVLTAVFVPTALVSGISGQFYRQFALTIAIATLISAFNSLTLSPALAGLLIRPARAKKDLLSRLIDTFLGWFFRLFNRTFDLGIAAYGAVGRRLLRVSGLVLVV
jgi:multidrug efflux pump subunit AcrB